MNILEAKFIAVVQTSEGAEFAGFRTVEEARKYVESSLDYNWPGYIIKAERIEAMVNV